VLAGKKWGAGPGKGLGPQRCGKKEQKKDAQGAHVSPVKKRSKEIRVREKTKEIRMEKKGGRVELKFRDREGSSASDLNTFIFADQGRSRKSKQAWLKKGRRTAQKNRSGNKNPSATPTRRGPFHVLFLGPFFPEKRGATPNREGRG